MSQEGGWLFLFLSSFIKIKSTYNIVSGIQCDDLIHTFCKMIIAIGRLTHPSPHIITFLCVWVVRTFKISFSHFQSYNAALLSIVTMLYITFPEGTHHINRSLYTLTSISPFQLPPSSWQPPRYSLFLWVRLLDSTFKNIIQYLSWSDLFHLAQGPSMFCKWQDFLFL